MIESKRRLMVFITTALLELMSPRPTTAQDPLGLPGDLLLLKTRELQAKHDRARLQNDIDRGDTAGINRDLQLVRRHERGVERMRRWVRGDLFLPLAFSPLPPRTPPVPENPALIAHPQYPGYGYFPSDPNHLYRLPQVAAVTGAGTSADAPSSPAPASAQFSVEIRNAGQPGACVDFFIDGAAYRIDGGERQKLSVSPGAKVVYDRGGGLGTQRYSLSAGVYEFRPGKSGLAFFRLGVTR